MYQLFTSSIYCDRIIAEGPQFASEEECKKYYCYKYVSTEARGIAQDYSWISKVNKDGSPKVIKKFKTKRI